MPNQRERGALDESVQDRLPVLVARKSYDEVFGLVTTHRDQIIPKAKVGGEV
jgi:hypothetical protein